MQGTEDILGHRAVIDRLWAALSRDALHHAYLFEGPSGLGKHLVARRLAMAANCEAVDADGVDPARHPCGVCPSCRAILRGEHADVIELGPDPDKKTPTITVSQVREVVRQVGYHRYTGRRRVVIVDPAEAMAAPAANALLKTLEEPPEGTGFILVAHSASSLLPTIVSRCQRVRFAAVPVEALEGWLQDNGHADGPILARLALGRPGAALALSDGGLDARRALRDQVIRHIERGDLGDLFELSKGICAGDRQAWLVEVERVLELLEDGLRDAVVVASGEPVELLDGEASDQAARWADALWPTGIARLQQSLEDARAGLARNASGRVVLDALFLRFSSELGRL